MPEATLDARRRPRRGPRRHGPRRATTTARQVLDGLAALGIELRRRGRRCSRTRASRSSSSWNELIGDRSAGGADAGDRDGRKPSAAGDGEPTTRPVGELSLGCRDPEAVRPATVLGARRRDGVAERLAAPRTPTLWGPDAEAEAAIRLGWVDLPATSAAAGAELGGLRAELPPSGSTTWCSPAWAARRWRPRSSPAPPAWPLTVLDTTDPDQVRAALADRRAHRASWWPASPAARSRPTATGGPSSRRSPTPGYRRRGRPDRRRHRPRLAAGATARRGCGLPRCSWPTRTSAAATAR